MGSVRVIWMQLWKDFDWSRIWYKNYWKVKCKNSKSSKLEGFKNLNSSLPHDDRKNEIWGCTGGTHCMSFYRGNRSEGLNTSTTIPVIKFHGDILCPSKYSIP